MLPLYVDLDGTLIRGDTMRQASLKLLRRNPVRLLVAGIYMLFDRPKGKAMIGRVIDLDAARLQYRPLIMAYVAEARAQGRRVVLATGTQQKYADAVAAYAGPFDAVYGTTETGVNLTGENKLAAIRADGGDAFEYMGDSHQDIVIFRHATVGVWVGNKALGLTVDGTKLKRMCADD